MADVVEFTNNYRDMSTQSGYQFEFMCQRCGNGYQSQFQRSLGSIGRIAAMGGTLLGGAVGGRAEEVGYESMWLTSGGQGKGRGHDKALAKAAAEVQKYFTQCHRCGQWVCQKICWNEQRGLCVQCAPKLDQEIAAVQAETQVAQVTTKIQQEDLTEGINYRDEATAICPECGKETGGGKFCKFCGHALAAAPASSGAFCANCGTKLGDANFCPECGASA